MPKASEVAEKNAVFSELDSDIQIPADIKLKSGPPNAIMISSVYEEYGVFPDSFSPERCVESFLK